MNDINERWAACLHEAGHLVAAAVCSATPRGVVVPFGPPDDTQPTYGCAFHDHLVEGSLDRALVAAAGRAGAELAEHYAPEREPEHTADGPKSVENALTKLEVISMGNAITDESAMKMFAVAVANPDRWANRYRWVEHVARRIVRDHAPLIVRLANAIYRYSMLAESELAELIPFQKTPDNDVEATEHEH